MKWVFQPSILSQMRLAWMRLARAALALTTDLGLGLTGLKPFLPRADRAGLAMHLGFAEALLRRVLLLEAARLGPLSAAARKPAAADTTRAKPRKWPASGAARLPAFRLFERAGKTGTSGAAPPRPFIPGPRILYLDAPLPPPEPGEYPVRADDMVPTGRLIPRLHALNRALATPAPLIRTLRRKMVTGWCPMLAPIVLPAFQSSRFDRDDAHALRDLHTDAIIIDAALDTS